MFRNWIAKLLTILLTLSVPLPLSARRSAQEKAPTIQGQIIQMPAGSVIEVKTQAKQKLRGRLGAVAVDSFELRTAIGGTVQNQSLRFDEVKSVKGLQASGTNRSHWVRNLVIVGVAVGVVIGLAILAYDKSGLS